MLVSMSLQGIRCYKTTILYVIRFLVIYIYHIPYLPEYETRIFVEWYFVSLCFKYCHNVMFKIKVTRIFV